MHTDEGAVKTTDSAAQHERKLVRIAYMLAVVAPIVTAGLYFGTLCSRGVDPGFPLDDSWIHAQYARTFIEGRPLEYVPGQRSMGTTSLLFDLVWASATAVTREYVYTCYVLNLVLTCGVGAVLVALLIRFHVPPLTAGIGAALIVSGYPFPWSTLSGMETALAAFLTVAAVLAHITWGRRRGVYPLMAPVLMALSAMARPENLILYPLSEIDRLLIRIRRPGEHDGSRPILRFATRALAFGLTVLPYFAVNDAIHGGPVPNTYAAKIGELRFGQHVEAEGVAAILTRWTVAWNVIDDAFLIVWKKDNAVLMAAVAIGILFTVVPRYGKRERSDRGARTYLADVIVLGLVLVCMLFVGQAGRDLSLIARLMGMAIFVMAAVAFRYYPLHEHSPANGSILPLLTFVGGLGAVGMATLAFFFPAQAQRYLLQWIPLILIYGVIGVHALACIVSTMFQPAVRRRVYACVVALVAVGDVILLGYLYPRQVNYYVDSVDNINRMQVALGRWVDENTPADAVIATNDIGAIAFFGKRPIVDTIGLIDPEIVRRKHEPNGKDLIMEYLQERGVTHALLFPRWHADLLLDARFVWKDRVLLEANVVCGDDRMIVSELDWERKADPSDMPEWAAEEIENCQYHLKTWKRFISL